MGESRKANFFVILIFLGVIVAFAYSYNASVTTAVADVAYNDKEILQNYNNEIITKLIEEPSTDGWSEIVEQYADIVIIIENSDNKVVTKSIGRIWSALDVKVQTPFEYQGKAYVIKSSVYLLRDYAGDVKELVQFIFIEFIIGLSALSLLIFTIYTIMLKHYRGLYKAIEEYDKTGKLKDVKLKGYAGEIYGRFVSMTKNLEKQQDNQRRIIASISHDIKTPLTSIMGYSERLKKDNISEERRNRYIDTVYGKSIEIRELVDEFDEYLSYNSLQKINTEEMNGYSIAEFIYNEYADEIENEGVEFRLRDTSDANMKVNIDIQKFRRVFGNIFSNSIKHINSSKPLIEAEIKSEKSCIVISLSDNGEGVEKDKRELIFEPFYTSDEGRKVAGLGLAICREIVERQGGKIYADESSYGGLKVCIEMPVK